MGGWTLLVLRIKHTRTLSSIVGILTGFNPGRMCKGFTGMLGFAEIGGGTC